MSTYPVIGSSVAATWSLPQPYLERSSQRRLKSIPAPPRCRGEAEHPAAAALEDHPFLLDPYTTSRAAAAPLLPCLSSKVAR